MELKYIHDEHDKRQLGLKPPLQMACATHQKAHTTVGVGVFQTVNQIRGQQWRVLELGLMDVLEIQWLPLPGISG